MNQVETFFRKSRRWLSRSEWLIRLLRLTKTPGVASEPGLVLIQIDGLSRQQFERAMANGNLPFLAQLRREHKYELHSLYSGLPSSTPAMTAELLYGVKCAVPAFSFYDRSGQTLFRMFEARSAKEIDRRLQAQGPPLLAGGSAYASIYTGAAAETHFCVSTMGLDDLLRPRYPLRLLIILLSSVLSLVRVGVLMTIEFLLAFIDFVRGLIVGQDLWKEIKFIPFRVGVSILMRELATIGAKIDVTRGLPVVYLDLLGYDEQAHRRGPKSRFAHWSLQGIDHAISRIWKAARRSGQRDYDVWIFSDHGSEETVSYLQKHGRTLQEAVAEVFDGTVRALITEHNGAGAQSRKLRRSLAGRSHLRPQGSHEAQGQQRSPVVAAMGPVGHVYVERALDRREQERLAQTLVERAQIPMVTAVEGGDHVRVWTTEGQFVLPDDAARVFAPDHPFLEEMTRDFLALCRHPDAGDFVLCGWRRNGPYTTFPIENGSHAGPGLEETHAFALLPDDAPVHRHGKDYLRPLDLRQAALHHLGRDVGRHILTPVRAARTDVLRLLTYNVHSCVGIDGRLSPRRIARVIARYQPDAVALQEVDVGRSRTGQADQAQIIAEYLKMEYHFNPTIQVEEEAYGDCVLSRLPMHLVKTGMLPGHMPLRAHYKPEPRGALWVALELGGRQVQLINTHLGLNGREKLLQIQALLGSHWLGGLNGSVPAILCGDFNASPLSKVWRLCCGELRDVQILRSNWSARATWFGHFPIARIDHIFVNARVRVVRVDVGNDYLARLASDHRPLFAELEISR